MKTFRHAVEVAKIADELIRKVPRHKTVVAEQLVLAIDSVTESNE